MKSTAHKLLFALTTLLAVGTSPLRAELTPPNGSFFSPQFLLGDDTDGNPVYYLDYFNTYTYAADDTAYLYKYNFGYLYFFGGSGVSGNDDAYFYDFTSDDYFYTAPDLYPYFYSFNEDSFLYYFEDSDPREFYEFSTDSYIFY